MFGLGTHTECEATGEYYTLYPNGAVSTSEDYDYLEEAGILTRPDGSQCQAESGFQFSVLACPLGWANGCFNEQNSSSSSTEEEPSSSSGEPGESSSSGESDLCSEFPGLPICEGDGGSDGGGSSGSGSGGTCSDLSNCDWAKLDVQLIQLGVGVEIRNSIRDIIGLLNNGYNISQQQLQQLQGLRNDLIGSVGSGVNEIVNAINGLENSLNGIGGGGNISGGVADGLGQFASDTTGSGSLDSLLGSFDFGDGGQMGDSLGDGRGIRNRIKESIGIDSSSFAFLGTGGDCPVFQTSFNTGVMGIRNDGNINLCDVYGFNAASVLRAMMWLIVITSCLFMNLHTLKTGGRS